MMTMHAARRSGTTFLRTVLLLLAGAVAVGCGQLNGYAERSLQASEATPRELLVTASFVDVEVVATPGAMVGIDAKVELRTDGGNETAEREIDRFAMHVSRDGDQLVIGQGPPGESLGMSGRRSGSGRVRIALPENVPLSIRTASGDITVRGALGQVAVDVRTASGDVLFDDVALASMRVTTASGDATVRLTSGADSVTLTSASGDVRLLAGQNVRISRASASSASGDVRLERLAGPAEISTASGDVDVQLVALAAGDVVTIKTASGAARVDVGPGLEPHGRATTASGGIGIELPVTLEQRNATLLGREDAGTLNVSTASGSIRIRRMAG